MVREATLYTDYLEKIPDEERVERIVRGIINAPGIDLGDRDIAQIRSDLLQLDPIHQVGYVVENLFRGKEQCDVTFFERADEIDLEKVGLASEDAASLSPLFDLLESYTGFPMFVDHFSEEEAKNGQRGFRQMLNTYFGREFFDIFGMNKIRGGHTGNLLSNLEQTREIFTFYPQLEPFIPALDKLIGAIQRTFINEAHYKTLSREQKVETVVFVDKQLRNFLERFPQTTSA